MKKQLVYIAPLRVGIMFAVLFGLFWLISSLASEILHFLNFGDFGFFWRLQLFNALIIGCITGFFSGAIAAFLYNLITKWIGGIEFVVRDSPSSK